MSFGHLFRSCETKNVKAGNESREVILHPPIEEKELTTHLGY